jgi:3-deoxy-D-manno-octulosonic-acid transferase
MRPFQRWLYPCALDAVYAATILAITPWLLATRRAGHSYGHVVRRRGNVEIGSTDRPRLWIHGVSVGEVLSVRALVRTIQQSFPEWELVFSATSRAGLSVVRRLYPEHISFEYPLDFSWAVRRAMDRVRPDLILIVEHELWPNFLHQAHLHGVPAVVVNAQISDRSIRGYRLLSRFMRWPPPAIVHYCAQNAETLNRLSGLGVEPEKVTVTGNLKYDNPCHDARDLRTELGIPPQSWVMVGASTHDGEEAILFQAFQRLRSRDPAARLVLIPRNVERVGQIERLIRHGGFEAHLRSMTNGGIPPGQDPRGVIVVDTMGELPAFCRLGNVVFVGGTLVPFGGHNVIEPASLGRPVVVGPHTENFRSVIQDFLGAGAISVADGVEGLSRILERFHGDRRIAEEMGDRARQVVLSSGGATQRTFDVLARIMEGIHSSRPGLLASQTQNG